MAAAEPEKPALDGGEPPVYKQAEKEDGNQVGYSGPIKPQQRPLHDPNVTFEEYYYYAQQTRADEDRHPRHGRETSVWSMLFPSKSDGGVTRAGETGGEVEKMNLGDPSLRATISDEEWANASRAMRTATRGAAFYLITTDILGPFALPFAFATMGWG